MNILVTGGAGFIGTNLTEYYLKKGHRVCIFDNFARSGSQKNLAWLKTLGGNLHIVKGNIVKDILLIKKEVEKSDVVFHFAAQVAVTSSVLDPRSDFEVNARGTFELLELIRQSKARPVIFYSSTNKVYGEMNDIPVVEKKTRYSYKKLPWGVSEKQLLDFHSPYGCSKGVADQYMRDYGRIYGLKTVVFRQSCVYGLRQFGVEDQGWVAWFIIALSLGKKIKIYGNGKQVRDLLDVRDLVRAYDLCLKNIKKTSGQIYNIGGGIKNTMSVWYEFKPILEKLFQKKITAEFVRWRPGDQPIFISDNRKALRDFSWKPQISVEQGIKDLYQWVVKNPQLFKDFI